MLETFRGSFLAKINLENSASVGFIKNSFFYDARSHEQKKIVYLTGRISSQIQIITAILTSFITHPLY